MRFYSRAAPRASKIFPRASPARTARPASPFGLPVSRIQTKPGVCCRIADVPSDIRRESEEAQFQRVSLRLNELSNTSSQILIFLSFAIVAGVTYESSNLDPVRRSALSSALHWWTGAIFPTVVGMIPMKEFNDHSIRWHRFLMWMRFALMWTGCVCIFVGAIYFFKAI